MSTLREMFLISLDLHLTRNCWSWRFNTKESFLHYTFLTFANVVNDKQFDNHYTRTLMMTVDLSIEQAKLQY